MEIRTGSVWFEPVTGAVTEPKTQTFIFDRPVVEAAVGLVGYSVGFRDSTLSGHKEGRPFGKLRVRLDKNIEANSVQVEVFYALRDWSGEFDDKYEAIINFVVLAELESPTETVREDLLITGMEYTQGIQFFDSESHLNPSAQMPDNSIPLVAGKDTAIRVYVDYDDSLGLPPITSLSGTMSVLAPGGTQELSPVQPITPRRAVSIDRGRSDHTLNFIIPAALCNGQLTVRCRVFDETTPTDQSPLSERTLGFVTTRLLGVFGVGYQWNATNPTLPAPNQAALANALADVQRWYPTLSVSITGFTTGSINQDINGTVQNIPDSFAQLLDGLEDMRGDSTDIYYGIIPAAAQTGTLAGLGRPGVGASFLPSTWAVAHEIGHAHGLDHAPATGTADPIEPDYPVYGNYPSGSIGEFGYDLAGDNALDPATTFDFMGYVPPVWISPFNYVALLGQFVGEMILDAQSGPSTLAAKERFLFLRLVIDRLRNVSREPSFHYPAPTRPQFGRPTDFMVELHDVCGNVLVCRTLYEDDPYVHTCWPKKFRRQLPFPAEAQRLVVWENDQKLYEECISAPPDVTVSCDATERGLALNWTATDGRTRAGDFWYLVQWRDAAGVWRGLAPRTQENSALVPANLFGSQNNWAVRVLATSGIATGVGECRTSAPTPPDRTVGVVLVGNPGNPPLPVPATGATTRDYVRALAIDQAGRTVNEADFRWFDQAGVELARGAAINLGGLPTYVRRISVVAVNMAQYAGTVQQSWAVKRGQRKYTLTPIQLPVQPPKKRKKKPEKRRKADKKRKDSY